MNRRTFLLMTATLALKLPNVWSSTNIDCWPIEGLFDNEKIRSPIDDWLFEILPPDNATVRLPDETGNLIREHYNYLSKLFSFIGKKWDMFSIAPDMQSSFDALIYYKTNKLPSYLTEYIEASLIIDRLTQEIGNSDTALTKLLTPITGIEKFERTRLGRAQKHVSYEFIIWYVSQGGFDRFGYLNYNGYIKGSFSDPDNLPYRGA